MSKIYSPRIVTDSLVMCLDASQNKSYPAADLPVKDRLNLWLDAADDTAFSYSSGTTVSQWRDKSGQNNHAIVNGGSPVRSVAINSRKAVSFTSTSWFKCTTGTFASNATHFLVCRATTSSATYQRVYNGGSDGYLFFGALANNIATFWGTISSGWIDTNVNSPSITILNTLRIISAINNGSTGTPYYDGTAMSTKTTTNSFAYTGYELNSYSGGNTAQALIGEVCEIIVFNKQLSAIELKQVHTYLGQKWGISNTDRSIIDLSGNGINPEMSNTIFSPYNCGVIDFNGKAIGTNAVSVMKTTTSLIDRADGQEITVSCWIKPLRTSGQYSVFCTNRSDNDAIYNWIFYQHTNDGAISFHGDNQNKSSYVPTVNQWVNVVATVTGAGLLTLYINGASNYTVSGYTYGNGTPSRLGIGADPSSAEGFQGSMGQTLIYNRALSAAEVAQNYEAQKSKFANTIIQQGLVLNLDAGNPYSYAGAGTTIYDVSGNSNNGTLTNSPTYSNNSIVFSNTANQSISISDTATLQPTSVTLSAWVYMTQYNPLNDFDGQFPTILWKCNDGNSGGAASYGLSLATGGYPRFTIAPTPLVSATTFPIATWVNLVGVYTVGGSQILYRNGVVDIATTGPATISYSAQVVSVGTRVFNGTYQYPWNGSISNALIHNRALTAAEVLQNYNATKGRFGL
jgi:hypothetical protein